MLFSMSKLTGHAGTRLGWALVKDHQFASDMDAYIRAVSLHVSIDSQVCQMQQLSFSFLLTSLVSPLLVFPHSTERQFC